MEFENSYAENSRVEVTGYAPLGRRFVAFVIDSLILGVLMVVAANIIPVLGGVLVWFFYGPILEASELRATIGKHLMGIQVADLMGRRISLRASIVRNALKLVSGAFICLGFLFALFTAKKQTFHDLLADTTVVYGRSEMPVVDAWAAMSREVLRAGKASFSPGSTQAAPASADPAPHGSAMDESIVSQLERLQNLRAQGVLSDSDFETAKNKILGKPTV